MLGFLPTEDDLTTGLVNVDVLAQQEKDDPSVEDCRLQVSRIVQSASFRNATTLQSLFQFLTDRAIEGSGQSLKEYTIGVEALGRKSDFDPKLDPIVRVQSHRLRVKLREYYQGEGRLDPVLIQFPKGHYVPTFEKMPASLPDTGEASASTPELLSDALQSDPVEIITEPPSEPTFRPGWRFVLALVAFALIFITAGYWLGVRHDERTSGLETSVNPRQDPVAAFWARFLAGDTAPVIAYPDAVFLLDDSNDLFRFRHGAIDSRGALVDPHVAYEFASNPALVEKAGKLYYENGYTGTGELESVAMLAGLFGRMGVKPILKSSRDVTPDDLKQHNVILLGSPFQNPAVAQLMTAEDFSFSNPDQHHEQWRAQILNAHPKNGESSSYGTERDAVSKVLLADYGLITIAPGVIPGRWIAIIGGLDTKGTEGAATFMTSQHGIDSLNKTLFGSGQKKKELTPFQALVHVRLAKGYQVLGSDLVSVHPASN